MRSHKRFPTTLAVALMLAMAGFVTGVAHAEVTVYGIDHSHSEITFQVRHLVTKVRGNFTGFDGEIRMDSENPSESSVEFTIDAATINTDNEQRDGHLRSPDFFDVENHPSITFASTRVEKASDNEYYVTGDLDMHGVSKEITLPVTFLGAMEFMGGMRAGFETEIEIDRKDWGISWNRALDQGGAILGDDVSIEINLETIKKEAEEEEAAE